MIGASYVNNPRTEESPMSLSRMALAGLAAAAALTLTGCGGGYDETAHRADVADALQVDNLDEDTWGKVRELADERCASDEETFALDVGLTLDGDDPDRGVAMWRANTEHVCPDRAEELEGVLTELGYAG